ncbi:hypothetical protein WOLCODRAFT_146763 [Wolfiporia cocos MD-104 SS10]|uniref:Uncharacterized protein n=1 Tax=Wolfiporia cocos (strain MD-104) TaxID=742152 RepID=A0A2H3JBB1_WOLCO|nr:hypothetical protein WOLCODRAFT_146763 [Wolfiporia cocos MD-104 SS10]
MSDPNKSHRHRKPPTAAEVLYAVQVTLDKYVDTNPFTLIPTIEDVCAVLVGIAEKIRSVQGNEEIRIHIATSLRKLASAVKSLSDLARDKVEQSFTIVQLDVQITEDPQLQTTIQTLITRLKTIDSHAGLESTLQDVLDGLNEAGRIFETCSRADIERIADNALLRPITEWTRLHGRLSPTTETEKD